MCEEVQLAVVQQNNNQLTTLPGTQTQFVFLFVLHSCPGLVRLLTSPNLVNRFSFQNENRLALISALDETSSLFTGTGKISTLGNLHRGESLVSDVSALFPRVLQDLFLCQVSMFSAGRGFSRGSINFLIPVSQHRRGGFY